MKNYASLSVAICLSVALSAGCATSNLTSGASTNDSATHPSSGDVRHTVAPGDRLSDISLKYTGRVDQWQAIASYNKITDPRTLRIGDIITIPTNMIPGQKSRLTGSGDGNAGGNTLGSGQSGVTSTGTLGLQRTREAQASKSQARDVHIAPVTANRTFELNPIDSSNLTTSQRYGTKPPQVRVIGTYYPKGVYQQPASYSKLMMRVTPGTVFELDQVVNDWYKVNTDQGIGYIRIEDGSLLSDQ